jgi:hypothetical protein
MALMAGPSREDLVEQVDDLLEGIHGSIEVPEAEPSVEALSEIVEALRASNAEPPGGDDPLVPVISAELVDLDDCDEPTRQWVREPTPQAAAASRAKPKPRLIPAAPPSAKGFPLFVDESLVDSYDDQPETPATLRPSSVSLDAAAGESEGRRPARRAPKRRVPRALLAGAGAAVVAAALAYGLGPRSGAPPQQAAMRAAAPVHSLADDPRYAVPPRADRPRDEAAATDSAADATTPQRVVVEVWPPTAYLSIRLLTEPEGKHTAGPWPRAFELVPGEYELVAFRAGFKTSLRRVVVKPELAPQALNITLVADDIYE